MCLLTTLDLHEDTTIIFEELLGLSALVSRILSACVYMWQIANTLVAFKTIDSIGRRKLMMV